MAPGLLAAFWILSFSLVLTPGADWAYAISAGLRDRVLVSAICGMLLGYAAITAIVAAGVGAMVASAPELLTFLTFIGAGYLAYLGIGTLLTPPVPAEVGEVTSGSASAWAVRGFAVSGLNPKALLLFVALLPQFTSETANWSVRLQIAAMGAVHILNCAVVYSSVGVGSQRLLRTRPAVARLVGRFSGIAMIVVAALLMIEQASAIAGKA